METKKLDDLGTYALRLDPGDEIISCFTEFAKKENIRAAQFNAIGVLKEVTVYHFIQEKGELEFTKIDELVEVLSLVGNISRADDEPYIHAHITVAGRDTLARGGHLVEGFVWPTLESIVRVFPRSLDRKMDKNLGFQYFSLDVEDKR